MNDPRTIPSGWFAAAFSSELKPREIKAKHLFGQDLVLYRTDAGKACIADAHCPHLGAHLGRGGSVEGELLRCGFHGFCFDAAGRCTETGYGSPPPPNATLRSWPVQEKNGVVLVFHGPVGEVPDWEVPTLDAEGWTMLRGKTFELPVHPFDVFENGVDLGHFPFVHGYSSVRLDGDIEFGYPTMRARYAMNRRARFGPTVRTLRLEYDIAQYGLGYDVITSYETSLGMRTRHFIMPIPIDERRCEVRLAVNLATGGGASDGMHPLLRRVPASFLGAVLGRVVLREFVKDHLQDVRFWTDRSHVAHPQLTKGDGPIHLYRRWAQQFLGPAGESARSSDASPVAGAG